jgi:hydroxymethylpyrimidine/phosphomethylpyrimidine kinase
MMPIALTIAGSDPSGGAGIQADLKTFSVLGVYGMSAVTAVTAQNTTGVKEAVAMEARFVRDQIDTVAGDIHVDACKTGMLANREIVELVAEAIRRNKLAPYVCDPVMFAKSGDKLLKEDAIEALRKLLFPLATVVTPNRREVALLIGSNPDALTSVAAAKDAARRLLGLGAKAAIVKGIDSDRQVVDLFFDGREFLEFASDRQPSEKSHGSGCVFSAAITAGLANRLELIPAIDQAKQVVTMAIQYSDGQGRGTAPVNVLAFAPKKK